MMKQRLLKIMLPIFVLSLAVGCAKPADKPAQTPVVDQPLETVEPITLTVSVPDGVPALTMTKMIHENNVIDENVTIEYTVEKTTDALGAKVMSGEADIAIVPSNLAAQTYNKELGYKIAATGSWGSFYLISGDEAIVEPNDFKGKEITTIGKNLTPDIMLRHILALKEVEADKDVAINYLNGATELAPSYLSGKAAMASVPEPMLSIIMEKKPATTILLDFNEEWKKAHDSKDGYPQSSLIIKSDVIEKNKEFVEKFLVAYEESINWANSNPEELGEYAVALELAVNPAVLPEALKRANMKYVPIEESRDDYKTFFQVLFDMEPKTIGGKMPDEGLFFK